MYYNNNLINQAITNLERASSYLKRANNFSGHKLVDECQTISDSWQTKERKISGLNALDDENMEVFGQDVLASNLNQVPNEFLNLDKNSLPSFETKNKKIFVSQLKTVFDLNDEEIDNVISGKEKLTEILDNKPTYRVELQKKELTNQFLTSLNQDSNFQKFNLKNYDDIATAISSQEKIVNDLENERNKIAFIKIGNTEIDANRMSIELASGKFDNLSYNVDIRLFNEMLKQIPDNPPDMKKLEIYRDSDGNFNWTYRDDLTGNIINASSIMEKEYLFIGTGEDLNIDIEFIEKQIEKIKPIDTQLIKEREILNILQSVKKSIDYQSNYFANYINPYIFNEDFNEKSSIKWQEEEIISSLLNPSSYIRDNYGNYTSEFMKIYGDSIEHDDYGYVDLKNLENHPELMQALTAATINGSDITFQEKGIFYSEDTGYSLCIKDTTFLESLGKIISGMDDTHKAIFNYIYNTDGGEAALKFIQSADVMNHINEEYLTQEKAKWEKYTIAEDGESQFLKSLRASLVSIAIRPFEGLSSVVYSIRANSYKEKTYSGAMFMGSSYARELVGNTIDSDFWKFMYNTGMSMADSSLLMLATVATGGNTSFIWSTLIMGTPSYTEKYNEMIERGFTQEQAMQAGLISSFIDSLTESYSTGHLLNLEGNLDKLTAKGLAKIESALGTGKFSTLAKTLYIMVVGMNNQGLAGGEEEACSSVLSLIYDLIASGEASVINTRVEELMQNDSLMTEDEALFVALKEASTDITMSFIGGYISEFLMGGFSSLDAAMKYNNADGIQGIQILYDTNPDLADVKLQEVNAAAQELNLPPLYFNTDGEISIDFEQNQSTLESSNTTKTVQNASSNEVLASQIGEITSNIDEQLGFGKGIELIEKYAETGDINEIAKLGLRNSLLEISFPKLKEYVTMRQSGDYELSFDGLIKGLLKKSDKESINSNGNISQLSYQEQELVMRINKEIKRKGYYNLVINSSTEISTAVLNLINRIDRLNITLLDGLGDGNLNLKNKYQTSRYVNRVTYTGAEMQSIIETIERISSKVDKSLTKIEQAKQIYRLVAENFSYSRVYKNFENGHQVVASLRGITSDNILGEKGLVCAGYAEIFNELCARNGIQSDYVRGKSYSASLTGEDVHAWNVVNIDGVEIPVDCCWASSLSEENIYKWFGKSAEFEARHIADSDEKYKVYNGNAKTNNDLNFVFQQVLNFCNNDYNQALERMQKGIYNPNQITRTNGARNIYLSFSMNEIKNFVQTKLQEVSYQATPSINNEVSQNNTSISNLEFVYETMLSYYNNNQKLALKAMKDGINNPNYITSKNGARGIFQQMSLEEIENFINSKSNIKTPTTPVVEQIIQQESIPEIKVQEIIQPEKIEIKENQIHNEEKIKMSSEKQNSKVTLEEKIVERTIESLSYYTGIGYRDINQILSQTTAHEDYMFTSNSGSMRSNIDFDYSNEQNYVKNLTRIKDMYRLMVNDHIISKNEYSQSVFRGTTIEDLEGFKSGLTGFISTTYSKNAAIAFAARALDPNGKVVLKINVDADVPCIVPQNYSIDVVAGENELILPPFCEIDYSDNYGHNVTIKKGKYTRSDVTLEQVLSERTGLESSLKQYQTLSEQLCDSLAYLNEASSKLNSDVIITEMKNIDTLQVDLNTVKKEILGYKKNIKAYLMNEFIKIEEVATGKPYVEIAKTDTSEINNKSFSKATVSELLKKYFLSKSEKTLSENVSSSDYKTTGGINRIYEEYYQYNFKPRMTTIRTEIEQAKTSNQSIGTTSVTETGDYINITIDGRTERFSYSQYKILQSYLGNNWVDSLSFMEQKTAKKILIECKEEINSYNEWSSNKVLMITNTKLNQVSENRYSLQKGNSKYDISKKCVDMLNTIYGDHVANVFYNIDSSDIPRTIGRLESLASEFEIKLEQIEKEAKIEMRKLDKLDGIKNNKVQDIKNIEILDTNESSNIDILEEPEIIDASLPHYEPYL